MKSLNKMSFWSKFFVGISVSLFSTISITMAEAEAKPARVFAPPSNVRSYPNGPVICTLKRVTNIEVWGNVNGWYETDACGRRGYIHNSQIRFQNASQSSSESPTNCMVTNIRSGQLALRKFPNGEAIAGLNNGNIVRYIQGDFPWYKVQVIQGPNNRINNRVGWVNADYLECWWD